MTPSAEAGLGLALGVGMMGGAAVLDLRTRRIPSIYWTPWVLIAAALTAGRLLTDTTRPGLVLNLAAPVLIAGLAYLLWRLRLWGGADAKAIMVLAFLAPKPWLLDAVPPALGAVLLGSLLVCAAPPAFFLFNLLRGDVALPGALLGTRMETTRARRLHVWPLQDAQPDGSLRWRLRSRIGEDLRLAYDALERAGHRHVWVTPKVPFLALAALGFAVFAGWALVAGPMVMAGP